MREEAARVWRGWCGAWMGLGAVLGEIPAASAGMTELILRGCDGVAGAGVAELWVCGAAELRARAMVQRRGGSNLCGGGDALWLMMRATWETRHCPNSGMTRLR